MISREEFVKACTYAIQKTREKIAITNQVSGYQKFHGEIKENQYFENCRTMMNSNERTQGYNLFFQHDLIEYTGLGNCHELAEYLCVELLSVLKQHKANARLRIVSSRESDHVYLHVRVLLKGECDASLWEVDAWDPRILDITQRPNGTIKNKEFLNYGDKPELKYAIGTDEVPHKISKYSFFSLPKPVVGEPKGDATPVWQFTEKHDFMYDDYTLEEAYKSGKLNPQGDVLYMQQISSWQVAESSSDNDSMCVRGASSLTS
ncbi:hypothetical protein [Legionella brunensis]|uniref:Uncharacterized protein n=1 Tax=Legionella brunensis TaxID=29422 RepID=A0A0W0S4X5_9GAMM|nr:hypothetical protein [Legionella brunensis]KTC78402.1 hypothetical protein Lbru_2694 [Legionella brunensis]